MLIETVFTCITFVMKNNKHITRRRGGGEYCAIPMSCAIVAVCLS